MIRDAHMKFLEFHFWNPDVYEELVRLARRARRGGHQRIGIKMIWEVIRWNRGLLARNRDSFKLNNNYHAFYARRIMKKEPDLAGIFELRGPAANDNEVPKRNGRPPGVPNTPDWTCVGKVKLADNKLSGREDAASHPSDTTSGGPSTGVGVPTEVPLGESIRDQRHRLDVGKRRPYHEGTSGGGPRARTAERQGSAT